MTFVYCRSENKDLEFKHRQAERVKRLFDMHMMTDVTDARHFLKDKVAHRHVLGSIAARKELDPAHDPNLGKYGLGASRFEIMPEIEREKERMEPFNRRKKFCEHLLRQRRKMTVVQRSLDDEMILRSWTSRNKTVIDGELMIPKSDKRIHGRLMLPPIQARPMHAKAAPIMDNTPITDTVSDGRTTAPMPDQVGENEFSSVFITEKGLTNP